MRNRGLPKLLLLEVCSVLLAFVALALIQAGRPKQASHAAQDDPQLEAVRQQRLPASDSPYAGLSGRLAAVDGDILTIMDGEGEHAVVVDDQTILSRPAGHAWVSDRELSRLQIGDNVHVAGHRQPDGSLLAGVISANSFVTHDGIVAARGPDYLDVRMRLDRLSTQYDSSPTRIWFAPDAQSRRLTPISTPTTATSGDFEVGTWVSFQGFFADNGDWVALYLYPTGRTGP